MYNFKFLEEILWAAGIAAALLVLQTLVLFDPSKIQDWSTWIITLGGGLVRAVAGAIIAKVTNPVTIAAK